MRRVLLRLGVGLVNKCIEPGNRIFRKYEVNANIYILDAIMPVYAACLYSDVSDEDVARMVSGMRLRVNNLEVW
jgi:hypothetical protein